MKIVFAFGMSNPLSIIVVATNISASFRTNATIAFSRSCASICPCPTVTFASRHEDTNLVGDFVNVLHAVMDEVHLPAAVHLAQNRVADQFVVPTVDASLHRLSVWGGVSRLLISRIPSNDAWSVRGIGVAVISQHVHGRAHGASVASLCSTPNALFLVDHH